MAVRPPSPTPHAVVPSAQNQGIVHSDLGAIPNAPADLTGSVLGDTYRVLRVLDEGGMGRLYRAEHVRLRRPVAVKVLAGHLTTNPDALVRFRREAEIVSQLHHPHIVHILDFDTTDTGAPYIVMELLNGETLSQRLDREGKLPLSDVVPIVVQTAGALHLAHQVGIVHRDLKPDNIFLLAMDDATAFVKLLDFGISKLTTSSSHVTGEYDVLGTPDYMAPEQAVSTTRVDHRSDQYALATMAYEMLAGRMPFVAESVVDLLHQVVYGTPIPLQEVAEGVPHKVVKVIERAMCRAPDERFATMHDFAVALMDAFESSQAKTPGSPIDPRSYLKTEPPRPERPRISAPAEAREVRELTQRPLGLSVAAERALPLPTAPQANGIKQIEVSPLKSARLRRSDPPPSPAIATPPLGIHLPPALGVAPNGDPRQPPILTNIPSELAGTSPRPTPSRESPTPITPSRSPRPSTPPPAKRGASPPPPDEIPSPETPRLASGQPTPRVPPGPKPSSAPPSRASKRPGTRSKAPRASSKEPAAIANSWPSPSNPTADDVGALIEEARRAVAFGEQSRASTYARRALRLLRVCPDPVARKLVEDATDLLEPLLLELLGGRDKKVQLIQTPSARDSFLTPEQLFVVSRIDSATTVDELLDLSPLHRPETLDLMLELQTHRIVQLA